MIIYNFDDRKYEDDHDIIIMNDHMINKNHHMIIIYPGEARRVIFGIWLISFLSASPWALFTKVGCLHHRHRHRHSSFAITIINKES